MADVQTAAQKFAVFLPVGPGELEVTRLMDSLQSLVHYEPAVDAILLVDDSGSDRQLAKRVTDRVGVRCVDVPHPTYGRHHGWSAGLCIADMIALSWTRDNAKVNFLLKMDTDALVIAPFAEKIFTKIAQDSNIGLLGACGTACDGTPITPAFMPATVARYQHWIWLFKNTRIDRSYFRQAIWGGSGRVRRALKTAVANGYQLGNCCQGGAYAISMNLIEKLHQTGWLIDPRMWLGVGFSEDVAMAILCTAVGMKMEPMMHAGEPFGIKQHGLGYEPQELVDKGYSIIHSIKNDTRMNETTIRDLFRQRRESTGRANLNPG